MSNPCIYIVVANFYPSVGGIQQQALIQTQNLRDRGYEATIITFRDDKTWLPYEIVEDIPVIRVAGLLLGDREKFPRLLQRLLYLMAMGVMGWMLWRYRRYYDILHVYQLNLLALPTALVCWLTGKSMIVAVRCADSGKSVLPYKSSLVVGSLDATAPWLQVSGSKREVGDLEGLERMGKPIAFLTRFLIKWISARVIILSSRMQIELAAHNFHLLKTQLIPNGVDIVHFAPGANTSIDQCPPIVVCVTRLCYQKGIDVLLQAWYLVHHHLSQAQLIIVGDGPLRNQLEQMAKALGIVDSVEFAGSQRDVLAQLHQASVAILPSRWEGMPNTLLEAMACGLPCVATRVSGSEDIIQHGVNGLLVEPEDYQAMAQALLTLLRDPVLAQQYGRAARATIEQYYSLEHITDIYVDLYQTIVDDRRRRSYRRQRQVTSLRSEER